MAGVRWRFFSVSCCLGLVVCLFVIAPALLSITCIVCSLVGRGKRVCGSDAFLFVVFGVCVHVALF